MTDIISLSEIKFYTIIGICDFERKALQPVISKYFLYIWQNIEML